MNCVSHAQVFGFHVVAIVFLLYLGDLFVCSCICSTLVKSGTNENLKLLNKEALTWTKYVTLTDLNLKSSERGTNDARMYTPCILCHIIRCGFFKFCYFVVKCDFQIKMIFSSLKLFF